MAQARRRGSQETSDEAQALVRFAERIATKRGGREALERLAHADDSEISLAALIFPEPVGKLAFFDPARFANRSAIRTFVCSPEFSAYMVLAGQALIGGSAIPDESGPVPEALLERARETLHGVLADLSRLATLAAKEDGGPIAFSDSVAEAPRMEQLVALARIAASLASEGAPPDHWQPIYEALIKTGTPAC